MKIKNQPMPLWGKVLFGIPFTIVVSVIVTFLLMLVAGPLAIPFGFAFFIFMLAKVFFPSAMRDRRKD